jgi:hypothetical protein
MKSKFFTILLISVLFSACSIMDSIDEGIYICVDNISDFDIENLVIEEADFKTVKSAKDSRYEKVESLSLQGNILLSFYEGKVETTTISRNDFMLECGTGIRHLDAGKYTLEIDVVQNELNVPTAFIFNLITD